MNKCLVSDLYSFKPAKPLWIDYDDCYYDDYDDDDGDIHSFWDVM